MRRQYTWITNLFQLVFPPRIRPVSAHQLPRFEKMSPNLTRQNTCTRYANPP
jgi:hypothetical protein